VSAVADNVYPACVSSAACPHGNFTTCESGHSGSGLELSTAASPTSSSGWVAAAPRNSTSSS
jgi:hypothetical protein